jgi:hypothetical protein
VSNFFKGELDMLRKLVILVFFVQCSSLLANTVSFADLPSDYGFLPPDSFYTEDGITVHGGINFPHGHPETVHMDDVGASLVSGGDIVTVTAGGGFNPVSFDILPYTYSSHGYIHNDESGSYQLIRLSFDNILVQGFQNEILIAEDTFNVYDFSTYSFDSNFTDLDALKIEVLFPSETFIKNLMEEDYPGYEFDWATCDPCTHFDIDNITLTPVPLPATLPLFASAFGLFGFKRYKKAN